MEVVFGTVLPEHIKASLLDTDDEHLEDLRLWGKSKEEIVEHISDSCLNGLIYLLYQDNIALLFMDKTPYTLYLTVLPARGYKANKVTRILQETITTFKEKCDIHKLETTTTCPVIWKYLYKNGFQEEGRLVDSRRIPSGEFVDEYLMGYLIDV